MLTMENWKLLVVMEYFVCNKVRRRIFKGVFQKKSKAHQMFRKTNISYPLIHTCTSTYKGVRNVHFSENLACFVLLKYLFWDSPFYLVNDDLRAYIIIAVICCYLKRENYKLLKFYVNNTSYFKKRLLLKVNLH